MWRAAVRIREGPVECICANPPGYSQMTLCVHYHRKSIWTVKTSCTSLPCHAAEDPLISSLDTVIVTGHSCSTFWMYSPTVWRWCKNYSISSILFGTKENHPQLVVASFPPWKTIINKSLAKTGHLIWRDFEFYLFLCPLDFCVPFFFQMPVWFLCLQCLLQILQWLLLLQTNVRAQFW